MIELKTEHELTLVERSNGVKWKAEVINTAQIEDEKGIKGVSVTTTYTSENNTFEDILHKVKLDLHTNLHYGFSLPIRIKIERVE